MKKILEVIKQIFCRHDYRWYVKDEKYHCISGERQYLVCKKCGKIKDTRFIKYD